MREIIWWLEVKYWEIKAWIGHQQGKHRNLKRKPGWCNLCLKEIVNKND